jgi:quercetin dioxygenase-like cupin family protein
MSAVVDRQLAPMKELFRRDEDIPEIQVTGVEGDIFSSPLAMKLLMVTPDMHCVKVSRQKGFVDPKHSHDDHSTICCLLTGKLRLGIGEEVFLAEPGDVWLYPQGVPHSSEALEDSSQIEVKAPACKTW